uniref:Uncharacterized protein n=1 Tax=uncultured bacterium contig00154 TaxID=1181592 RepID=A0A806KKZ3_9BACT|nr:hypothetical protein [uncultured bacterium contig00154]
MRASRTEDTHTRRNLKTGRALRADGLFAVSAIVRRPREFSACVALAHCYIITQT